MELHFPIILDGATGTELQKRGYSSGICAEQWCLEHPDAIQEIQRNYVDAGSNIVYAPTFGANQVKLEENKIFNQVRDYNQRLAALSKEVTGDQAYVAADLAPTGLFLAPMGETSFEELVEIYTEQAKALEEAGVDLFTIETTMTMAEARAAVLAVKSVSKKPVFVTFTCDEKGKTLTGTDVTAALVVMQGMGVDAFGLNCSVGPDQMLIQLQRLREYAEVPLIAKPNAGIPEIVEGKTVYPCQPEEFASYIGDFAQTGVAIFGGCCGTTPEHIRAIKAAAEQAQIALPDPKHLDLLPCATEKEVFYLSPDVPCTRILPCDADLGDALEEALDGPEPVIGIRIAAEEELDYFADNQYAITKPLCLCCDDAGLLEQALRLYQGRALYQGTLSEKELLPLVKRYGLII